MFLDDSDLHPRVRQRIELTEQIIAAGRRDFRVETRGETAIERLISLVLLGDLVSLYVAALPGVDPGPVQGDRRAEGSARGSETEGARSRGGRALKFEIGRGALRRALDPPRSTSFEARALT